MEKWFFTFGCGQQYAGFCQPIISFNREEARNKMFEIYGEEWSFQYSAEEWEKYKNNGVWTVEKELSEIICS